MEIFFKKLVWSLSFFNLPSISSFSSSCPRKFLFGSKMWDRCYSYCMLTYFISMPLLQGRVVVLMKCFSSLYLLLCFSSVFVLNLLIKAIFLILYLVQFSGLLKDALAYVKWLKEDQRFSGVLFQVSPALGGHAFPRLRLRYKPSLVQASNIVIGFLCLSSSSCYLSDLVFPSISFPTISIWFVGTTFIEFTVLPMITGLGEVT